MHAVTATPANEADINQAAHLLSGEEKVVFADAGYTGMDQRPEVISKAPEALFLVAAKPSKIRAVKRGTVKATTEALEKAKASVKALVKHPFQIKRRFGYAKARHRGIGKNLAKLEILFALANLALAKRFIMPRARITA